MGLVEEKNTAKRDCQLNQTLATNWSDDNEQLFPLCLICNRMDETIAHITNKCSRLDQNHCRLR